MVRRHVLTPRAALVALGVPAAFAGMWALLALPSAAQASTSTDTTTATILAAPAAVTTTRDFSVHRAAVLDARRIVDRAFVVDTEDPVAFITIDDGVVKDEHALALVRESQVPITAFVSTWTVKDRADYFTAITEWGSIQNHTATHANLTEDTTDLRHELCYSQKFFKRTFGERPWILRPPYGAGAEESDVLRTAMTCGMSDVVLWDALVQDGAVSSSRPIEAGSVLLLHFTDELHNDLRAALDAIEAAGLQPANLADYLPRPSTKQGE